MSYISVAYAWALLQQEIRHLSSDDSFSWFIHSNILTLVINKYTL